MSGRRLPASLGRRCRGVVLLALLLALALAGLAAMGAADVWSLARQREREQQLLFAGNQYRQAIQRYYFGAPPGSVRVLPARLEDLLEDDRFPVPVRHLRRLYPDPITGDTQWGVLKLGDRVAGVYSLSEMVPVKKAGFAMGAVHFEGAQTYRDWLFAVSATGQLLTARPTPPDTPIPAIEPPSPSRPSRRTPS